MREVTYQDDAGRLFRVQIPKTSPDSHAKYGIVIGPPDLSSLGLPTEIEVRLNNQLFHRHLWTLEEARANRKEIITAMQATFAVDAEKIISMYRGQ